jgi:hypothetical protein
MTLFLKADVHAAAIGPAAVLLDLDADSYLCLAQGGAALRRLPCGATAIMDGPEAAALAEAGLVTTVPPSGLRPVPDKPTRTVIHDLATAGVADLWPALSAALEQRSIRTGAGIKAYLPGPGMPGGGRDTGAVARAAGAFWQLAPWLPVEGECLVRSSMLMRFLRRRGLSADWVFGVRLYPFMAHCWVQIDDLCLNDDVERLAAYTPLVCR